MISFLGRSLFASKCNALSAESSLSSCLTNGGYLKRHGFDFGLPRLAAEAVPSSSFRLGAAFFLLFMHSIIFFSQDPYR